MGPPDYRKCLKLAERLQRQRQQGERELMLLRGAYLEACLQHVKAEYWAMFHKMTKASPEPGWRAKECHLFKIEAGRVPESDGHVLQMRDFDDNKANYDVTIESALDFRQGGMEASLVNLKGYLCIWRDNLFLTHKTKFSCGCKSNSLMNRGGCAIHKKAKPILLMRKLRAMLPDFPDSEAARHEERDTNLYLMDLVMPAIKLMTVIESMRKELANGEKKNLLPAGAPDWSLLDVLCQPGSAHLAGSSVFRCDAAAAWLAEADADADTPLNQAQDVRLRPEQLGVINSLHHRLELIQGPPGTGKSTIIRAIIRDRLPYDAVGDSVASDAVSETSEFVPPIRTYLATAQERARSEYPDEDSLQIQGWVTTAGSSADPARRDDATDPDAKHLVALDCEMVETRSGSALARVSLVDADGVTLYDSYVKPGERILDYRTQFSGITLEVLAGVYVTLADVQARLLEILTKDSIIVGHSLENDLSALKLVHNRVVDTALIFPHPCGWPYRRSLARLCGKLLNREMDRANGHDSVMDARMSMELARLKFEQGPECGKVVGSTVTLLLAVQNKAIDVLVRGMEPFVDNDVRTSDVKMLVVGSASNPNMGATAASYTMDNLLLQNEAYRILDAQFETLLLRPDSPYRESALAAIMEELKELRSNLMEQIVSGARIVFSTTSEMFNVISHPVFRESMTHRISSVIIDEAGTLPEYDATLLACLPGVQRVIAIGDVQQLPPFSNLSHHVRPDSLMARMQEQLSAGDRGAVRMLQRQFRMSRFICSFVSDSFYSSRLIMDNTEGARRMPEFVPGGGLWLSGIYWLDYSADPPTHVQQQVLNRDGHSQIEIRRIRGGQFGQQVAQGSCEEDVFKSKVNATEIHHIICCLEVFAERHFFQSGCLQCKSVAVICFYKQQCKVLEASLAQSRMYGVLQAAMEGEMLRIRTVDSFQGNEADVVILSGVRSNSDGAVGFLSSAEGKKRICVATSRAREALIIVGDRNTLAVPELAFSRLWSGGQPSSEYEVRRLRNAGDLVQPALAAAARRHEENLIGDMFG